MAWTSPRTWVPGESPTAATMNTHIRDQFATIGDPWFAYTPIWTSSGTNPVIGNGTITGAYRWTGQTVNFWAQIVMGSTTTFGTGSWFITAPIAPANYRWLFSGVSRDASASASYSLGAEYDTTLPLRLRNIGVSPVTGVSSTSPFTWANTDTLFISGTYEAA